MIIDIYGNLTSRSHFFLPVIREMDKRKDIKLNLMGDVHSSVSHIKNRKYIPADVALGIGTPKEISGMHAQDYSLKMGYTSWETNKVPYGASYGLKSSLEKLDLLILPDNWQAKLFEHVGVPTRVIPLPIDSILKPIERGKDNLPFIYLCEGTLTLKHNVGLLISAFLDLHRDDEDFRLVLKTDSGTLGHLSFPYKNIEILDTIYPQAKYLSLLAKADVFVYPARGDSYPISLLNAMATDLPAIVPSHSTFEDIEGIKLQKSKLVPAERYSPKLGDVGSYWQVDYEELKEMLKFAYSYSEKNKQEAKKIGQVIRTRHKVNSFINDIIKMVKDNSNG